MTVTYGAGPSGKKRPPSRPSGRDLDRMVFGPADDEPDDVEPEPRSRSRQPREDAGYAGAGRAGRDYSRLPEGSGVYPRVEDNRRGPLILAAALALVLVFGLVVWNAYRDGVRPADGEAAPQLAEAGPFKSRPDPSLEPADPVAEASVFDTVEPSSPDPEASETSASPLESADPAAPGVAVPSATEVRPEPPPAAASATAQPSAAVQSGPASASPKSAPSPASAPAPVASAPPPPATVSPPAAPARPAGAGGPAFSAGGNYVVQLGAPSSEAAAQAEWDRRRRAMPELLGGAERFIVRADVNGRTVYRVRAGSFATAADADAFCGMIKARGGDCFRTEK